MEFIQPDKHLQESKGGFIIKESDQRIDWSIPGNVAEQHKVRYMDQALHATFVDVESPVTYETTKKRVDGLTPDKVTATITKVELLRIRDHVLFNRRQNFIDTGGEGATLDATIKFGAQQQI